MFQRCLKSSSPLCSRGVSRTLDRMAAQNRMHGPGSGRRDQRAAALVACCGTLLVACLAAWVRGDGVGDAPSAAALLEGDPSHHERGTPVREVWGIRLAALHDEWHPATMLAGRANATNATHGLPARPSAADARAAMHRFYNKMLGEEEKKLEEPHAETMRRVKEQHSEMSEFDARDSVDHLPEYERWVEQQNEEQFAQREKEEHDAQKRAAQDVKRAMSRSTRRPEADQRAEEREEEKEDRAADVQGGTLRDEAAGDVKSAPAAEADPVVMDGKHLSADAARQARDSYFEALRLKDEQQRLARRRARERLARKWERSKEADAARVMRELQDSPGAGNLDPPDMQAHGLEEIRTRVLKDPVLSTSRRSKSRTDSALAGSRMQSLAAEDVHKMSKNVQALAKRNKVPDHAAEMSTSNRQRRQQQRLAEISKEASPYELAVDPEPRLHETLREMTRHSRFVPSSEDSR